MIEQTPRLNLEPIRRQGTIVVNGRVLLNRSGIVIASLKFAPGATIAEHSASIEIDVLCLDDQGFVSIDGKSSTFRANGFIVWPAGVNHRLGTENAAMETLLVERNGE